MSHTFEGHIILLPWFQFYPLQNLCRGLTVALAFGKCVDKKTEQKVFKFHSTSGSTPVELFFYSFFLAQHLRLELSEEPLGVKL